MFINMNLAPSVALVDHETVLWTNSSPASNFAAQSVTLNDNFYNYDLIRLYYRGYTSVANEIYIEFEPASLIYDSSSAHAFVIITGWSSNGAFSRLVRDGSSSNTGETIWFDSAYQYNKQASNNGYAIPTKIVGITKALGTDEDVTNYRVIKEWGGTAASSIQFTSKENDCYLALIFGTNTAVSNYMAYDGTTCSGGTITKIMNLMPSNNYAFGTYFLIKATSNVITLTTPSACAYQIFKGE